MKVIYSDNKLLFSKLFPSGNRSIVPWAAIYSSGQEQCENGEMTKHVFLEAADALFDSLVVK